MASRMDVFVTGPVSERGTWDITLHVRTRQNGPKNGASTCQFNDIDAALLYSTSKLFWKKQAAHVYIVWKEFKIVEAYIKWLYERIIHRIPEDETKASRPYHTLLKYPEHPLKDYSPLVRDIHTLVNMWLFGFYIEDATFMDTVMSFLNEVLEGDHKPEYDDGLPVKETFIRFLKPSVIEAIWTRTIPGAKLRAFVIDQILLYGSNNHIVRFSAIKSERKDNPVAVAPLTSRPLRSEVMTHSSVRPQREGSSAFEESVPDSSHDDTSEITSLVYPVEFVNELGRAQRSTVLVSQLAVDVQSLYKDQVRVFLPPPPYSPDLMGRQSYEELTPSSYPPFNAVVIREPSEAMSLLEMTGSERNNFLNAVYGKGEIILRSSFWEHNFEKNSGNFDSEMKDDENFSTDKLHTVKMSCVYHEHTDDDACWLLGKRFRRGIPQPAET